MALTLTDLKAWLRVTSADDDALITAMITAARKWAETYTGIKIANDAAYIQTFDEWGYYLELEAWPVNSITSVQYVDTDGVTQTWNSSNYTLDTRQGLARIYPAYNESFPTIRAQREAITVTYNTGYSTVPEDIEVAIKMVVANFYEQRENFVVGMTITEVPFSASMMLDPYRMNFYVDS